VSGPNPATVFGLPAPPVVTAPPEPPAAPSPAEIAAHVAPGVVCRIYMGTSLCYSTKRMTLAEAAQIADEVDRARVEKDRLFAFPSAHHERVSIAPEFIRSVEVVRVDAVARSLHTQDGPVNLGPRRSGRAS
jgi:hypothetical protein